jgi:hypothetical protein
MRVEAGHVYRWSASHGNDDKHCVVLVIDSAGFNWRCLVLDGNHVPGYGEATPGRTIIWSGSYLVSMKKIV